MGSEPNSSDPTLYDAVIIGGGPAGLSAGIWLGRYGRRVRVIDGGNPRNAPTWAVHGFPGLPDLDPDSLRLRLRNQCLGVGCELRAGEVTGLSGTKDRFVVATEEQEVRARRVLLAFGRRDILPSIPGAEQLYGTSLFHCPDCDGPSMAGAAVGVVGNGRSSAALCLFLSFWAKSVVLLTHGAEPQLPSEQRTILSEEGIRVRSGTITACRSEGRKLRLVELAGGDEIPMDSLFFDTETVPACDLARPIGCNCDPEGHLQVDNGGESSVPGVYGAGDLLGHPYLAISAAAEGVRAALSMHRSLLPQGFALTGH